MSSGRDGTLTSRQKGADQAGIGAVDFSKLLDGTAVWAFVSVVVTQALNSLYQRQKVKTDGLVAARQADTEAKRQDSVDREAAFKQLMEVVNTLRDDTAKLREELDEERAARKTAEEKVTKLGFELLELRSEMQRQGMKVPSVPIGSPP